ncbi:hypothetical protein ACGFWE_34545 [Streptomyces sp. NPDC048523]|uniref:hypothetical protein n=1 Tax=Streptomyces sp. NPDC048523 TaxID=3365567 RepID=UPI0037196AEC
MYEIPLGASLIPKAYGCPYSPVGVVCVRWFREATSGTVTGWDLRDGVELDVGATTVIS